MGRRTYRICSILLAPPYYRYLFSFWSCFKRRSAAIVARLVSSSVSACEGHDWVSHPAKSPCIAIAAKYSRLVRPRVLSVYLFIPLYTSFSDGKAPLLPLTVLMC